MEKEMTKKKQRKSLIKNALISIGVVGASVLVIKAMMDGKKNRECQSMRVACKPSLKTKEIPTVKVKVKHKDFNEEAVVRKCNQLLKTLWKRGNPDSELYLNEAISLDMKSCLFSPYIDKH